jgi:hypothetical protein
MWGMPAIARARSASVSLHWRNQWGHPSRIRVAGVSVFIIKRNRGGNLSPRGALARSQRQASSRWADQRRKRSPTACIDPPRAGLSHHPGRIGDPWWNVCLDTPAQGQKCSPFWAAAAGHYPRNAAGQILKPAWHCKPFGMPLPWLDHWSLMKLELSDCWTQSDDSEVHIPRPLEPRCHKWHFNCLWITLWPTSNTCWWYITVISDPLQQLNSLCASISQQWPEDSLTGTGRCIYPLCSFNLGTANATRVQCLHPANWDLDAHSKVTRLVVTVSWIDETQTW